MNNEASAVLNEDDDTSLLVVILDCNVYSWGNREKSLQDAISGMNDDNNDDRYNGGIAIGNNINKRLANTSKTNYIGFNKFLEHFMVFVNAYLMLNQENQLGIICSKIGESSFVFPQTTVEQYQQEQEQLLQQQQLNENGEPLPPTANKTIQGQILDKLQKLDLEIKHEQSDVLSSSFSASMSMALCYINRIKRETPTIKPRILVFNISPDVSSQYISVMNCIFSSQKQSIPVDSCILSQLDSTFLQQASHLTSGIYLKPQKQELLSQYLLTTFLLDTLSRKSLAYPTLKSVDYRASCFCHKKIVDIGYVCSVCLSIFCGHSSSCSTCGTKFSLKIDLRKQSNINTNSTPLSTATTTSTVNNK
ncbi:hypothetical protein RB653_002506 [Dictyostelium firmibasis]|uniref:General transcription factor IIH subunit 3 n=1 Tax=Dictyostelium firmibasis TaxID=79012 RepID=A0AAN7U9A2_9MYCE